MSVKMYCNCYHHHQSFIKHTHGPITNSYKTNSNRQLKKKWTVLFLLFILLSLI